MIEMIGVVVIMRVGTQRSALQTAPETPVLFCSPTKISIHLQGVPFSVSIVYIVRPNVNINFYFFVEFCLVAPFACRLLTRPANEIVQEFSFLSLPAYANQR